MKKVHMVLQGKGGVGKSFASSMIAQYLLDRGENPVCIDADPVNATFAGFTKFNAEKVRLLEDGEINPRRFDEMMELIDRSNDTVIVDSGASSYTPLSAYMFDNGVPDLLHERGRQLVLHILVVGGQGLLDTVTGFASIAAAFSEKTAIVVWLNPYHGAIQHDGKSFEQLKAYLEHKKRVTSIITLPDLKEQTYGVDVRDMLKRSRTFAEALADPDVPLMQRHRLGRVRNAVFAELAKATII